MKRVIIILMCAVIVLAYGDALAQSGKRTRQRARRAAKTTQQTPSRQTMVEQTVPVIEAQPETHPEPQVPQPSFDDPLIVANVTSGYSIDNKLYLAVNEHYMTLNDFERGEVIEKFLNDYSCYDVIVSMPTGEQEWWVTTANAPIKTDVWNATSLDLKNYAPLELQTSGATRVFYSIGAMLNYMDGSFTSTLTMQAGTYLYKNLLDASVGVNAGYNKPKEGKGAFSGDLSLSAKAYLPLHLSNVHLSPYAGAGIAWNFAPSSFFEPRVLAGLCWFIGPGSLDIGGQWGSKSGFSVTFGYTFRPRFGAK